jgi:hypothetical protein
VLKNREEQHLKAAQMKFLRHLLGITKGDKEKNQCIREKREAQKIAKEIKQDQVKWLQHEQRMDTNRIPKQALQYNQKNEGTEDDRGRDGGTNFILRIKEQVTRLILHEHDDDDDDDKICLVHKDVIS